MPINPKVNLLIDTVLRVPLFFIMIAILSFDFDSFDPLQLFGLKSSEMNETNLSELSTFVPEKRQYKKFDSWLPEILVLGIGLPAVAFTTKQLVLIYIKIISLATIIFAYILNAGYIDINGTDGQISMLSGSSLYHFILLVLTTLFSITLPGNTIPQLATWILFFMPSLSFLLPLPPSVIQITPLLSVSGCLLLLAYSVWMHGFNVCRKVYDGLMWCHNFVKSSEILGIFEIHWVNLYIPQLFRIYWAIKNAIDIMEAINDSSELLTAHDIIKTSLISSTENHASLLGLISIVTFTVHTLAYLVHGFLDLKKPLDQEIGQLLGTIFFLLCIQGNITILDAETRYQQVSDHFLLLLLGILQFLYYEIKDELLSIGTSNTPSIEKHIKTLTIASLPIILSGTILIYMFSTDNSTTWLIYNLALNAEIMLKSVVTITIYTLLMIDTYKCGLWENLEDYIYNLKLGLSIAEFLLGISLVLTNIYVLFYESTSLYRIIVINAHLYLNVWLPFSKGQDIYEDHNSEMDDIKHLQVATTEQLREKKDICAICYQPLNAARITKCNHFFHGVCLRKWLQSQITCPLCFQNIKKPTPEMIIQQYAQMMDEIMG